jgi:hypothetical protein
MTTEWTPLPAGDSETLWDADTTAWDVTSGSNVGSTAWDAVAATTWTAITPAS